MIEKIVLDYLNQTLKVSVFMEKPAKPPEDYVLLEKTGGSSENYINSALHCNHTRKLYTPLLR